MLTNSDFLDLLLKEYQILISVYTGKNSPIIAMEREKFKLENPIRVQIDPYDLGPEVRRLEDIEGAYSQAMGDLVCAMREALKRRDQI